MSTEQATFCCLACRLIQIQPTSFHCCECSKTAGALQYEDEILRQKLRRQRSKAATVAINGGIAVGAVGAYAGAILGGIMLTPIIPAVALAGFAFGLGALVNRKRNALTTVPLLEPRTGENAVTKQGIARRIAETIDSIDGGVQVLAEDAILRGKHDGVLFRRVRAVPFLVELEGGDRLVVDGTLRVAPSKRLGPPAKPGDARLVTLDIVGVPASGELEVAVVRDGDPIEVTGETEVEAVQALAVDREGGETTVMRGRAQAVVLVRRR
ncbi:MAG TPA: hypothetical protein VLB44_21345 [Kofleriaceae bacterium]|nr:hypothetical protein [Kofleriaceae bacterium]